MVVEVVTQLNRETVRGIALTPTRGLARGAKVRDVGRPLRVPVGKQLGQDIAEFLPLAAKIPMTPEVQTYKLEDANRALIELKHRPIKGAKVLVIDD